MQKDIKVEDLYGTGAGVIPSGNMLTRQEIFAPVTNVAVSQDIYGTSVDASAGNTCIYGTTSAGIDIYGTAKQSGNKNVHLTGSDINGIRKSNTILPSVVPRPSMVSPVIGTTLSSAFVDLPSTKLNNPDSNSIVGPSFRSNTALNHSSIPSNSTSPALPIDTGFQSNPSTNTSFMIPQPSIVTSHVANTNTAPTIKVDNAFSGSAGESSNKTVSRDFAWNQTDEAGSFSAPSHNHQETPCMPSPKRIPTPVPHQPSIPIP